LGTALLLCVKPEVQAALANAWHVPDGDANFGGLYMRNPEFEVGTNTSVTIWSGVWKWSNGGSTLNCNQTGGWVIYNNATEAARYYKIQLLP
jgi:hypothetical protein